ncbi:MAG TPA: translocation/assembly module TamB domain-containing protein [Rhizomicrobium sp.]|nr:translocation/assembly module TamB domain-containing protein [Rhizomicrobium sp.]
MQQWKTIALRAERELRNLYRAGTNLLLQRWKAIAIRAGLGLLILLASLVILAVVLLRTGPGRSVVAAAISEFSDGHIRVHGLSGALPNSLRAESLEVADARGVWLQAENVTLDWRALAALDNHFVIRNVSATRVVVMRRPHRSEKSSGEEPNIEISSLSLPRVEIGAGLAGRKAVLSAQGSLHYRSSSNLGADIVVARLDNNDRYVAKGAIDNDVANGTVTISESDGGILAALAGLPSLGAVHLEARASGDSRANVLSLNVSAGMLEASGSGKIALRTRELDLDVQAHAPAMRPAPDIAWQSLSLSGHLHGPFDAPNANGTLTLAVAEIRGVTVRQLMTKLSGNSGVIDLEALADGLRVPGAHPDLFAGAPVSLDAHADLKAAHRPIHFSLAHPLLQVAGDATTSGTKTLTAKVVAPSLQAFAGDDAKGSASFTVSAAEQAEKIALDVDGKLNLDGTAPLARLLGHNATVRLKANLDGGDVTQSQIALGGAAVTVQAHGSFKKNALDYRLDARLSDLSRLAGTLKGEATLNATVSGPLDKAEAHVQGNALAASRGFAPQRVSFSVRTVGLPDPRLAHVEAQGRFDNAPVTLKADYAAPAGKAGRAVLAARWKSLDATGQVAVTRGALGTGTGQIKVGRLADFSSLAGTKLDGRLDANFELARQGSRDLLRLGARVNALTVENTRAGTATVNGTVTDPFGSPFFALAAATQGITVQGVTGDAQANLAGPLDKLAVTLKSALKDSSGMPATIDAAALVDARKKRAMLSRAAAQWRKETFALRAPATIDFTQGISVDRLVASVGGGTLKVSGSVSPKLAATVSVTNLPAQTLTPFVSDIPLTGTVSADANLTGTADAPKGTVTIRARSLRAGAYSTRSVAPADLDVFGTLDGRTARVNARLAAGASARVTVTGQAPLVRNAPLDLHVAGAADLALLDPVLMADARQAKGNVNADLHVTGALASPRMAGKMTLADGEVQDFARGLHLRDVAAVLEAQGGVIRVTALSARAGSGTITGSGTIDVASPGMPITLTLTAKDAQPVASDRVTATLSGDLKLTGRLDGAMALGGHIDVKHGDINLPDSFPPDVAVLNVRKRGAAPPPPPSQSAVSLDILVAVPGQIFVRGHGVDADFGGRIHITGTSGAPLVSGGFTMNRGSFSVAGQTLDFTTGKVSFDGTGVRQRLDPTLDLVAQTTSGGVTATLTVTGYASAPKIVLSSTPALPQDEVLAHLLFQQSMKQLSPLQLAGIAQAVAELGGVGSGFDPLGRVRKTLALDRLAVGSISTGSLPGQTQTTVEAGKYVLRNVYVGTKQSFSGGTQVQVQIDLTKTLKAQGTLSTMSSATATSGNAAQDNGSSVGLSYQIEY